MKKIAIQGEIGAYHEIAARKFFEGEEIEILPCHTFEDVFTSIKNDNSIIGIVAIENTIAGSLLPNYELLRSSDCRIFGEYKLRISHTFSALPGQKIEDIKEVHSHPVALMQCSNFLSQYPHIKVIESEDTALSAKEIMECKEKGKAAICSSLASEMYGLEALFKGIETNKRNFTRFLLVAEPWATEELSKKYNKNKASLVFSLPHSNGSLSKVLTILSFYEMNLSKIQSLPIIGHEWEYLFYVDLTFENYLRFKQSIDAIIPLTRNLKILGEYEDGKQSI